MAISDHTSPAEVTHYTVAAGQKDLAAQAMHARVKKDGECQLSNLTVRLDKPPSKRLINIGYFEKMADSECVDPVKDTGYNHYYTITYTDLNF